MAGYTRQEAANIITSNTIEASHFNNEYNAIEAAFHITTGHSHDGSTAGEGPKISLTGSVTGTLPVANGGTGAATLTDGGPLLGSGTGAITALGQPTNGQLIIGSTGVDPVLATLTAGEGIDITNGTGSITIDGEDATTSNKGIASFATADFGVTAGAVALNDAVVKSVATDASAATPATHSFGIIGGTGISTAGSGANVTVTADTASTTAVGVSELATAAETTAGTDTGRTITPAGLSDSDYGRWIFDFRIATPIVEDGAAFFETPAELAGMDIIEVSAQWNGTIGTGAATQIQLYNTTQAADVLSTVITIDDGERSSSTAATPPVIDLAQDDITSGDVYQVDIDQIGSTVAGTNLLVTIVARIP